MAGEHSPSLDQAVAAWVASDVSMTGQREMESTEVSERHLPKVFVTEMVVSMPELPGLGLFGGPSRHDGAGKVRATMSPHGCLKDGIGTRRGHSKGGVRVVDLKSMREVGERRGLICSNTKL